MVVDFREVRECERVSSRLLMSVYENVRAMELVISEREIVSGKKLVNMRF